MRVLLFVIIITISNLTLAQEKNYQVIKFPQLQEELNKKTDHLRVYNFWATWCRPCIQELPHFEALNQQFEDVEVILISFDFKDQHDRVGSFIEKRGLTSTVKILDETDFNAFLDKIDPSWSGAIPATLVVAPGNQQYFYEKAFEKNELFETIDKIKHQKL